MQRKNIKTLNENLPLLAFGCMRFPKKDEKIDFEQATEMIDYAMKNGLNYFDTAYPYHNGESETFLGKVLPKYERSSYFLTSKLPIWKIENEDDAEKVFNEQLEKCQTEYFDFYLLHAMNKQRVEVMEKFKLYDFLLEKKNQGKIKHIGFSFHDNNEVLEYLVSNYKWEFVQIQLNYYDWHEADAKELYTTLEKHNLPCFVMEPVRGGFLSSFAPNVEKYMTDYNKHASISSWAIRWVESLPNVAIVLSGMSNMEQLKDNINTVSNFEKITDDELKIIDTVVKELRKIKPIPCTGCKYCMPCLLSVNIAGTFAVYNNYKKTNNVTLTKNSYNNIPKEHRANNCIKCGACKKACPQHIDIPTELEKITNELKSIL